MANITNPILKATNTLASDNGAVNTKKVYWLTKNGTGSSSDLTFVLGTDESIRNFTWTFTNSTNRNNEYTALTVSSADLGNGATGKPFVTPSAAVIVPKTGRAGTADAINLDNVTNVSKVDDAQGYKIVFTFGPTSVAPSQVVWCFAGSSNRNTVYTEITNAVDIPQTLTGAGAVSLTTHTTLLVTTGANALTLAAGDEGQFKFIRMKTDGGDGTLTVTNLQGGTTITFNDAGDFVYLYYSDAKWHILTNSGTTVA